jgi:hypothetical protein
MVAESDLALETVAIVMLRLSRYTGVVSQLSHRQVLQESDLALESTANLLLTLSRFTMGLSLPLEKMVQESDLAMQAAAAILMLERS